MKAGKSMADCSALYKEKYPEPKKEEIAEVEQLAESAAKEEIELAKKKKKEDEYEHPEKKASELAPEIRKELDELKEKATELAKVREEFDELKEGASELAKVREEFGELKQEASELAKVREEFDELKLELLRLKEERRLAEIAQKVDEQIDEKHLAPKQRDHVIKLMAKLPVMYHDDLLQTFATQKFRGFEDVGRTEVRRPGEPEEIDEETRLRLLREHGIDDLIAERGVKRRAN
jgi:myosin heavy subunit